jgi:hypothetical protein
MEETLYPEKFDFSLQDIVIPGSHDAGMSVLTAAGGQQSGTINECNTLTQIQTIKDQLDAGIRMFDLRVGLYNNDIYTKHCSSDCMSDAIGGAYGEKLEDILKAIKLFLASNKKESIILSFSHFCEKELPASKTARYIADSLGSEFIFNAKGRKISEIKLHELSGKVLITFEHFATPDRMIDSCSIATQSPCLINFRRSYAATNALSSLLAKEKLFLQSFNHEKQKNNDLIRMDWQLTQSSDEAAMVCNDFQSEHINPLINGAMALTNALRNHHSIRDMSLAGNRALLPFINQSAASGLLAKNNKPNILYVDVAGNWITDYCIFLNNSSVYTR